MQKKFGMFFTFLILSRFLVNGQTEQAGIRFADSTLTWKEIQVKAKQENKYIFVDCYASWCGPCKYMSRNIFPQKEVGDFFNARFISITVQMDTTTKDVQAVKQWYADANIISQNYKVNEYPTYLIFSPAGNVLHKFSGATRDPKEFIAKAAGGLDSTKQYYTLMNHWKEHKGDSAFLINALNMALIMSDDLQAEQIGDEYIRSLKSPLSKNNLETIQQIIYSGRDLSFHLYLAHAKEIDSLMSSENYAEWPLKDIIFQEMIYPVCKNNGLVSWKQLVTSIKSAYPSIGDKLVILEGEQLNKYIRQEMRKAIDKDTLRCPDFKSISEKIRSKYIDYNPVTTDRLLLDQEAAYYSRKKQWDKCAETAYLLMTRHGDQMSEKDMDNIAWDYVFLHSGNKVILAEAAKWMKRTTTVNPKQADDLDTYANLLYKIGKKNEAIELQNKVIDVAIRENYMQGDIDGFKSNLEKMQKGINTWEE